MANKVLSIKMDEKDIERIKKYYEVLVKTGFLSPKTTSLNAFYKHLLLDYLEHDVSMAFEVYSKVGMSPRFVNPEKMDEDRSITLNNTYDLNSQMFEVYKECVKETLCKKIDEVRDCVDVFNDLVESEIVLTEGSICKMECYPGVDLEKRILSFWEDKVNEIIDLYDDCRENEIDEEISMIEKSSISQDLKQQLIINIREYDKKRKQNYYILQGRGIEE